MDHEAHAHGVGQAADDLHAHENERAARVQFRQAHDHAACREMPGR
jgi:hypothetical protein